MANILLNYLIVINIVTFLVYGIDKAASKRGQSQTRLSYAERKQARPKVKAEVFANAIKHDFKSKNPTTRWSDIIKLK